jgi:hypothetical protein
MLVNPYAQPWATNYQRQADDALFAATEASSEQLRALRPPLPQIRMNPPRFGYPDYATRQWNVMQVFGINRLPSGAIPGMPNMKGEDRVDYSRNQSTMSGSPRNENVDALGLGGGGV